MGELRLRRAERVPPPKLLCRVKVGPLPPTDFASQKLCATNLSATQKEGKNSLYIHTHSKMTLPLPPRNPAAPIPNPPFSSPEVYYVESPQGRLPIGQGLAVDAETGKISAD